VICVLSGQSTVELGPPAPDPESVNSIAEFIGLLRLLKVWAGDPSFQELQRRSGVPRSTLADAMSTRREQLPRMDLVRELVRACGAGDKLARWEAAWRIIRTRQVITDRMSRGRWSTPPRQLVRVTDDSLGRKEVLKQLDLLHPECIGGTTRGGVNEADDIDELIETPEQTEASTGGTPPSATWPRPSS
jgi:hypothetical protein